MRLPSLGLPQSASGPNNLSPFPPPIAVNNATEVGKLRLWPQVGANTVTLNLTVIVDNSVIEIFANDEFALTTRACVLLLVP